MENPEGASSRKNETLARKWIMKNVTTRRCPGKDARLNEKRQ